MLEAVARRHDVVAVVTQPDRPAGRGQKLTPVPVKRAAERLGLRVETPEKLRPFVEDARALAADAFVVASYGKIVPQMLLDAVPIAFNVHPSLLPLYRGATPLQSAIRDGRSETGVTIIAMDAGMDTGDVLLQRRESIGPHETYGELHDRLALQGAAMVLDALAYHLDGSLRRTPQDAVARTLGIDEDEVVRTRTHPLRKDDLVLDWSQPSRRVYDRIRSLAPQPLARTMLLFETVKILAARLVSVDELALEIGGAVTRTSVPQLGIVGGSRRIVCAGIDPNGLAAVVVDRLIAPNRGSLSGEEYARVLWPRLRGGQT